MDCVEIESFGVDLAWGEGTSARPANETGVVHLGSDGTILDAGWTVGVLETATWITARAGADALAFVDASLLVENPTGQRRCETQVGQRYGRWKVSANSTNLASPGQAGAALLEALTVEGWIYDDGLDGPPTGGRRLSECYPYTTLVGVEALGYDLRPLYKRKPKRMAAAEFKPLRAANCDELIRRIGGLADADPPLHLRSHPVTAALVDEPSPEAAGAYKHREDLLDAVICAWTAQYWLRWGTARCQVLGDRSRRPAPTIVAPCRPEQARPGE